MQLGYNDIMKSVRIAVKALRQLGLRQVGLYALYQMCLKSGVYRHIKPRNAHNDPMKSADLRRFMGQLRDCFTPDTERSINEAIAIAGGQYRPFGGQLSALDLTSPIPQQHWTDFENGRAHVDGDIRTIWEPARFSWAFTLAQAYQLTNDERFPLAFWKYFHDFQKSNPPYVGVQWVSSQEAALRILAFVFAEQAFSKSTSSSIERRQALHQAVEDHARRIPPTLIYARSQNNNHLLSEAVALYTTACLLPDHPYATRWRRLGWKWFNWAIQHQVDEDGCYMQHSSNYHRLMLALGVWMSILTDNQAQALPQLTRERLISATRWLQALIESESGHVPNLGANDGSDILPLSGKPVADFHPVVSAAHRAFGVEQNAWAQAVDMPCVQNSHSRAFLRAAKFDDRPSHADQLHVDLWWGSHNIAMDAGSLSYNAQAPWNNALSHTRTHNTLTVNDQDQMLSVGRFLWLDWAQAQISDQIVDETGRLVAISAWQNGYRQLGYLHCRTVTAGENDSWIIDDKLFRTRKHCQPISARCHWLLPDLPYKVNDNTVKLVHPLGEILVTIRGADTLALVRAGKCVYGEIGDPETLGWVSPTYQMRLPALSLTGSKSTAAEVSFSTFITLKINS